MVWRMQQEEVKERAPLLRCQSGTQHGSRSRILIFGMKHYKRQCRDSKGYMMSKCLETLQSAISSPAPRKAQDLSRHCHPGEEVEGIQELQRICSWHTLSVRSRVFAIQKYKASIVLIMKHRRLPLKFRRCRAH